MSLPLRKVEVLAPAGDDSALDAALAAGADAVYFGLQAFNARARASNFSADALPEVMARIHAAGARGYVTLNTLVFDHERDAARDAIRACEDSGVDALIVQDLGVAEWVRELARGMPLHASTQMTCTDADAISLARALGISRVVLPRELSVADIARLRSQTEAELEVFVYGALCVSYSGQCLASLSMGGRSANRGMCAQPCRLPYTLVVEGQPQQHGFVLSPCDLDASELIPQLLDAGVRALKIEGRMKGPSYVAATVRLVRAIARAWEEGQCVAPDPAVREAALQMFSRGSGPGFLRGIDHQRLVDPRTSDHRGVVAGTIESTRRMGGKSHLVVRTQASLACGDGILVEAADGEPELGGRVWGLRVGGSAVDAVAAGSEVAVWLGPERDPPEGLHGRRVFRTSSPTIESQVATWLKEGRPREALRVRVSGALGEPATFAGTTQDGRSAQVQSSVVLVRAERRPLTPELLADKLGRLGETSFRLDALEVQLPEGCILPVSALNDARRRLVAALTAKPLRAREDSAGARNGEAPLPPAPPPQTLVLCRREDQVQPALDAGASAIVLDLPDLKSTRRAVERLRQGPTPPPWIGVATLRVRKPGERVLDQSLIELNPDGVLARSMAWLGRDASHAGAMVVADASLNVANSSAARAVLSLGARAFTPAWDVPWDPERAWFDAALMPYVEFVVYGARPMFHTQHCLFAAHLSSGRDCTSCGRPCDSASLVLRDRTGRDHAVLVDRAGRNTVFEAASSERTALAAALRRRGVQRFRIDLVDESPAQVAVVLGAVLPRLT